MGVGWEAVGVGGVGSGDEVNPRGVCVEFEGYIWEWVMKEGEEGVGHTPQSVWNVGVGCVG